MTKKKKTVYWVEVVEVNKNWHTEETTFETILKYDIACSSQEKALQCAADDEDWICRLAYALYQKGYFKDVYPAEEDADGNDTDEMQLSYSLDNMSYEERKFYTPLFEALHTFIVSDMIDSPLPSDFDRLVEVHVKPIELAKATNY